MVKVKDLINGQTAFNELCKMELDIKISFRLANFTKEYTPIVNTFYEQRSELVKKLGKKEKNETYDLGENKDKFNEEINKLLDEKVTLKLPQIKLDNLPKKIKPEIITDLLWLIKE